MASYSSKGASSLSPLHKLSDYKVADKNLDVRGWEVLGTDGKRLGTVDDLIVDKNLLKVRYLDIDVDRHLLLPDTDTRHILVPIGAANLDEHNDQVFLSGIEQASLVRYPFYKGGVVDTDYEYRVMHAITSPNATFMAPSTNTHSATQDDFYNREQFDDSRFYRKGQPSNVSSAPVAAMTSSSTMPPSPAPVSAPAPSFTQHNNVSGSGHTVISDDIATIERLKQMLDQGTITHDEFTALKRKALGI